MRRASVSKVYIEIFKELMQTVKNFEDCKNQTHMKLAHRTHHISLSRVDSTTNRTYYVDNECDQIIKKLWEGKNVGSTYPGQIKIINYKRLS